MKINVSNDEQYRALTEALNKIFNGTYENKQKRPIKIIVKKLHHTCKPGNIIKDLLDRGYKVVDAVNKLKWKIKVPLNMFMITFEHDEDFNKIFAIKDIMGTKIEIQALKKSKLVPQCKRSQAYRHIQHYCAKDPRCVRCASKHLTAHCKKPKNTEPKCVHCGSNHPANYQGCEIAKEMQKIRNKNVKKPALPKQSDKQIQQDKEKNINQKRKDQVQTNTTNKTYSQVTMGTKNAKPST